MMAKRRIVKKSVRKNSVAKFKIGKTKWFWLTLLTTVVFVVIWTTRQEENNIVRKEVIASIPDGFPSFGIDVSHHQGKINWEKLMKKEHYDTIIHFVYCKATEGSDLLDDRFEYNRSELQRLGIANGAYHFFMTKNPPRPQADFFLENWKKTDMDLPPVLDVETEGFSDKDLISKMKIWLDVIEEKTGMRPVIYTSLSFFETKFKDHFKNYRFWIAAYSRRPNCLEDARIIHWQYSETGNLPHIDELVDFNVSKIALH